MTSNRKRLERILPSLLASAGLLNLAVSVLNLGFGGSVIAGTACLFGGIQAISLAAFLKTVAPK